MAWQDLGCRAAPHATVPAGDTPRPDDPRRRVGDKFLRQGVSCRVIMDIQREGYQGGELGITRDECEGARA